jgi:DNA-binding NarL/FixJ family response regulator
LGRTPEVAVVGEAENGREAIDLNRKLHPDVVVMDIVMPGLSGIETTRHIRQETPDARVLALSMHDSKWFVREMLQAGASGYLLKEHVFEELAAAIRAVAGNQRYLDAAIARFVESTVVPEPAEPLVAGHANEAR